MHWGLFYFLKHFWKTSPFWETHFRLVVMSPLGFKYRVDCVIRTLQRHICVLRIRWDSPLVWHLLTSWQQRIAWVLVFWVSVERENLRQPLWKSGFSSPKMHPSAKKIVSAIMKKLKNGSNSPKRPPNSLVSQASTETKNLHGPLWKKWKNVYSSPKTEQNQGFHFNLCSLTPPIIFTCDSMWRNVTIWVSQLPYIHRPHRKVMFWQACLSHSVLGGVWGLVGLRVCENGVWWRRGFG